MNSLPVAKALRSALTSFSPYSQDCDADENWLAASQTLVRTHPSTPVPLHLEGKA